MSNVLVVIAHPDDEALGCGGTIAKFVREGHDVRVFAFTDGGTSRVGGLSRVSQLIESSKILGFSILNLATTRPGLMREFNDNAMDTVPLLALVQELESVLASTNFKPDTVITHSPWCLNIDHKLAFSAAEVVFRGQPIRFMCFEIPSSSEWSLVNNFKANCFVSLTNDDASFKMIALTEAYGNELRAHPHPRSLTSISTVTSQCGIHLGLKLTEQFMILKEAM